MIAVADMPTFLRLFRLDGLDLVLEGGRELRLPDYLVATIRDHSDERLGRWLEANGTRVNVQATAHGRAEKELRLLWNLAGRPGALKAALVSAFAPTWFAVDLLLQARDGRLEGVRDIVILSDQHYAHRAAALVPGSDVAVHGIDWLVGSSRRLLLADAASHLRLHSLGALDTLLLSDRDLHLPDFVAHALRADGDPALAAWLEKNRGRITEQESHPWMTFQHQSRQWERAGRPEGGRPAADYPAWTRWICEQLAVNVREQRTAPEEFAVLVDDAECRAALLEAGVTVMDADTVTLE